MLSGCDGVHILDDSADVPNPFDMIGLVTAMQ